MNCKIKKSLLHHKLWCGWFSFFPGIFHPVLLDRIRATELSASAYSRTVRGQPECDSTAFPCFGLNTTHTSSLSHGNDESETRTRWTHGRWYGSTNGRQFTPGPKPAIRSVGGSAIFREAVVFFLEATLDYFWLLLQFDETKSRSESQRACGSFRTSCSFHGAMVVLLCFMTPSGIVVGYSCRIRYNNIIY